MRVLLTFLLILFVLGNPSIGMTHENFKRLGTSILGDFYLELDTIMSRRLGKSKPRSYSSLIKKLNELPEDHNWFSFDIIENFFHTQKKFEYSRRTNLEIQCTQRKYRINNSMFHKLRFGMGPITRSVDHRDRDWKKFSDIEPTRRRIKTDDFLYDMIKEGCDLKLEEIIGKENYQKYLEETLLKGLIIKE